MNEPKKILVIQLRRIGDVLLTTPAVAALKNRFPSSRIDFLVEPPCDEVLAGNPHLRQVLVYKPSGIREALEWLYTIRKERYDWVVDFLGNPRSAIITALSGAFVKAGPAHVSHRWAYDHPLTQSSKTQYAGLEKIRVLAALGVSASADFLPKLYLEAPRKAENLIAFAPASRRITRQWPADSYARLGRMLMERTDCAILVLWGPGERPLAERIAASIGGRASVVKETKDLQGLAREIARCRLVVTNCNGPKHFAVALGVPTVTIHGSSDPISWNPPHPDHLVARLDELFCIGCGLNRCPYKLECMTELSPEKVMEKAMSLLSRSSQGVGS